MATVVRTKAGVRVGRAGQGGRFNDRIVRKGNRQDMSAEKPDRDRSMAIDVTSRATSSTGAMTGRGRRNLAIHKAGRRASRKGSIRSVRPLGHAAGCAARSSKRSQRS